MEFDLTPETIAERVTNAPRPLLLDFWADWCMPCKMVEPILAEIAGEYEGILDVGRVNVDEMGEFAASHDVVSIPSLILFKNGAPVDRHVGAAPKDVIEEFLKPHLEE